MRNTTSSDMRFDGHWRWMDDAEPAYEQEGNDFVCKMPVNKQKARADPTGKAEAGTICYTWWLRLCGCI
jgi:hypothetical protein